MAVVAAGRTGRRNCDCVNRSAQGELNSPHSQSQKGSNRELFLPLSGCAILRRQDVGPFFAIVHM